MKRAKLTFLVGVLFATCAATQAAPNTQTGTSGETQGSLAPGATINAALKSSVDSKKAKPGDTVVAETTEAVKSADGRTILPRGAKLIGHVTQASARSKGENQSLLAIQFDKAETKNGQEVALGNLLVEAIAPPSQQASSYSSSPEPNGGAGQPRTNNPSMSGSTGPRTGSSTTGANPSNPYPGAASGPEGEGEGAGPLPPNSRGAYGIQGIKLGRMTSPNGQASVIQSEQKSVHLEWGTRLLFVEEQSNGSSTTPGQ